MGVRKTTMTASLVPQSNQRGIETVSFCPIWSRVSRPQSNQRGIETAERSEITIKVDGASIEPAWD